MSVAQRPPPGKFDIWSCIQADEKAKQEAATQEPYVHPSLMRWSSSLLSQKSLQVCTESLCSETGSDDFFSSDLFFSTAINTKAAAAAQQNEHPNNYLFESEERAVMRRKRLQQSTVNYHHCAISSSSSSSRRSSPPRSFPPPLPSLSRRDGQCLQMRPHRRDGRLIVEAVAVPSQNYLHAERQNGRLLLSFMTNNNNNNNTASSELDGELTDQQVQEQKQEDMMTAEAEAEEELEVEVEEEEEEEEEEVEVVDRGTVVEVKVSTQPPQAMKVHRSSIVINKFVSCTPAAAVNNDLTETAKPAPTSAVNSRVSPPRRLSSTPATTAAAAAVAASSVSAMSAEGGGDSPSDSRLLFASKRRNKEELLHDMRRCSQLRKPLFIWEPCCVATFILRGDPDHTHSLAAC